MTERELVLACEVCMMKAQSGSSVEDTDEKYAHLIKIPLLRLVIRNIVEFAEACKPEMSVLFVRVLD